eukprot:TRINITY_DN41752_c0_g1_i1.p1 TRINITY_DN41752_c0_g1~~TRINITY_DN41752_c0_g1_i1.p1  ORF type:complete len:707 (-),score=99.35 TRINITY_DN41752_c0_g1_i1:45-2057(-)
MAPVVVISAVGVRGLSGRASPRARCAATAPLPHRWLPTPVPAPQLDANPQHGWMAKERWKEKRALLEKDKAGSESSVDASRSRVPTSSCSALVHTVRRALDAPPDGRPMPSTFWKYAVRRGGRAVSYLDPEETCGLLTAFADARLRWEGDPRTKKAIGRFAAHAAEEIGSYAPDQMSSLVWAFARLDYHHEGLMQSLSRAVEHIVRFRRTRLDNDSVVTLLAAYKRLAVVDEPVMRDISRLVCRRLVREPLTPHQTAGVLVAFASLRVRDVALFNATTLALCKPGSVDALSWADMADVAVSYASLRLHSPTLSTCIRQRVVKETVDNFIMAGVSAEVVPTAQARAANDGLRHRARFTSSHQGRSANKRGVADFTAVEDAAETVRWQLESQPPDAPRKSLPSKVVSKFLQAQVHLDRLTASDLAPLLPHLAHPGVTRPTVALASALAIALSRGGHAWPWLWRWTSVAFSDESLPPQSLLSLLEALRGHLRLLEPLLTARATGGARGWKPEVLGHLRGVASNIVKLMKRLAHRCPAMSKVELELAASAMVSFSGEQRSLVTTFAEESKSSRTAALTDVGEQLMRATAAAARRLAAELKRRRLSSNDVGEVDEALLQELLGACGVSYVDVEEDARHFASDAIDNSVLVEGMELNESTIDGLGPFVDYSASPYT